MGLKLTTEGLIKIKSIGSNFIRSTNAVDVKKSWEYNDRLLFDMISQLVRNPDWIVSSNMEVVKWLAECIPLAGEFDGKMDKALARYDELILRSELALELQALKSNK